MAKEKKYLIIPVKNSIADDFACILDALRIAGEIDYMHHFRRTLSWASVDPANPYVEIRQDGGNEDERI